MSDILAIANWFNFTTKLSIVSPVGCLKAVRYASHDFGVRLIFILFNSQIFA
ncbi:hypothetical protein QUB80_13650 [Chlorogloeopsis sp. ULAP01]|uniref:hypothetical protein n=1 Tax=Chlorogloeopsis sp. ULAP01 TaxID=3056483 RepID=UPI0025AB4800|nr:hypothetical protein [Chlorogloeopsis sp. ULAP01]MDM9381747.1 hypothetical protein [Chlorogloeopsis sp. ULAP01]